MKFRTLVSAATLAAATAVPMVSVSAADPSSVTIVDGYQYDAMSLMAHTVCLDDILVKSDSTAVLTTLDIAPGTYQLSVTDGGVTSCDNPEAEWVSASVTVADTPSQSIGFGWPTRDDGQVRTLPVWQHSNPTSCTPEDQGRVILRNYLAYDEGAGAFLGAVQAESEPTALIGDVPNGGEGSALVAPPQYPAADSGMTLFAWVGSDDGEGTYPMVTSADEIPVTAGTTTIAYAFGGADGDPGVAVEQVPDVPCGEETTTTTTTPTTLPGKVSHDDLTPVAKPVVAQPAYTG